MDHLCLQLVYRGPGLVPVHLGVGASYDAAVWLSQNGRGGTVAWVIPNRAFVWRGINTTPGIAGGQTMDALAVGSAFVQENTAMMRTRGFITQELSRRFGE